MKNIILSLLICAFGIQSYALANEDDRACEQLIEDAADSCRQEMCDYQMEESGLDYCEADGDFHVAVSECASEELISVLEKYNKKNSSQLVCE